MRSRSVYLPLLLAALPFFFAHAASFDCKKAQTPREHAICDDPKLSQLDSELAATYTAARAQLSPKAFAQVLQDQRDWLRWIDEVCPIDPQGTPANLERVGQASMASCLMDHYATREKYLRIYHPPGTGITLFTRAYFAYSPDKPGDDATGDDPGFGSGSFLWPQIDRPTPRQDAWNNAIYAAAVKTTADDTNKSPTSFATSDVSGGWTDLEYAVRAVNDHLIDVDLVQSEYGYGAAHPNAVVVTSLWWLDRGRMLQPTDIFRAGSSWKTALALKIIAKLKSIPELGDALWEDQSLRQSVADEVGNAAAWTVTRSGLTVTFGEYEIGPRSIGMPSATINWTEISQYLSPTLNLADLPPATPDPR